MAFKYRTRDYSRPENPFTGEPWRTPEEFFKDARANRELRQMSRHLAMAEAYKKMSGDYEDEDDD